MYNEEPKNPNKTTKQTNKHKRIMNIHVYLLSLSEKFLHASSFLGKIAQFVPEMHK